MRVKKKHFSEFPKITNRTFLVATLKIHFFFHRSDLLRLNIFFSHDNWTTNCAPHLPLNDRLLYRLISIRNWCLQKFCPRFLYISDVSTQCVHNWPTVHLLVCVSALGGQLMWVTLFIVASPSPKHSYYFAFFACEHSCCGFIWCLLVLFYEGNAIVRNIKA